jgi:GNAT superfamily N-acetyltransferase
MLENPKSSELIGIRVVTTSAERKQFIRFPYELYKDEPNWVPPLLIEQKKLIDRKKNVFYKWADAEFFLAEKEGKVVGRIAAVIDRRFNEVHNSKIGFFAFFECINDKAVAALMLRVVNDWLKQRGMESMQGPTAPGMLDLIGFLVEGFEHPPSILMPYTKRYYPELVEAAGLSKLMDLLAYRVTKDHNNWPRIQRAIGALKERNKGVTIRRFDFNKLDREVNVLYEIYNKAWAKNWGYSPLSKEELYALAKDLKLILDPNIAAIAEFEGKPVGFSISLPDFNQIFKKIGNGRLFPFGIFKLLYYKNKIKDTRTALMGILPEFQGRGIDAMIHHEVISRGLPKGYESAEMSWILETNVDMIRLAEKLGGILEKRYRMYGKPLS